MTGECSVGRPLLNPLLTNNGKSETFKHLLRVENTSRSILHSWELCDLISLKSLGKMDVKHGSPYISLANTKSEQKHKKMVNSVKTSFKGEKSLIFAYFLWLCGGFFGLHHFYLRRDKQAFVHWTSLGGYGVGWLTDFFKMPEYVRDANDDPRFIADFIVKLQKYSKPPFSTSRFTGAVIIGFSWGQMFFSAIPTDEFIGVNWKFLYWFTCVPVALGVWMVGNIGRQKGSFLQPLLAAAATQPLRLWIIDDTVWMSLMVFAAALVFDSFSKKWNREPPKKEKLAKRVIVLGLWACLYISLWAGFLYFHGTIIDSEDNEIPIQDAIHHFFTSPWWVDLQQSLYDTYQYGQHHGWYEIWKQIIDLSDPHGEMNAYKVLGVSRDASQQEITAIWRKLSRENHPDKERDPILRAKKQEQFLEIQQAYEILSNTKSRRKRRNKKDSNSE